VFWGDSYPYVAPNGAEAFGCISVSIHTLPLTGQYVFWGDSYPYVAPNGAEAFGWVSLYPYVAPNGADGYSGWISLFLSIRCPERGNMCFGWDTFFLSITSCPARGFVGIGNDIHKKCLCPARGFVGIGNQEDLFKLTDLMQSLG
jgi:hypothetical protein